jgi:hypothetical protein
MYPAKKRNSRHWIYVLVLTFEGTYGQPRLSTLVRSCQRSASRQRGYCNHKSDQCGDRAERSWPDL